MDGLGVDWMDEKAVKGKQGQIGRRRYNTRSARVIKMWEQGPWSETLYRKKTGEYFVYGVGESFPEGIIRPLERKDAERWTRQRFGMKLQKVEDVPMEKLVMMSFYIPSKLRDDLRGRAADEKSTISSLIIEAIEQFMAD